ncbi:Bdr family repetitive protein [Borreliella burgdorferi]|uniref:Bdr family repetitive protein n=1 Tax=Borreliella burgdorferi TaxID=139 RepID=UPI001E48AB78|nr:Bdr family repetitive protein [Borreliella burgdorferi]MCD2372564.1 Bdr family repetitive protein [Borreliella burgdorferi]MCD2373566.1 Bdr family repetitive protein [Borreliella burgdorferi]MCD2377469.1 Bdr family repetitive protein [Borreliella burgdorferi]MCD2380026.1 Bdr family repetitive protein [Borreliella burgdorferi]MCD2383617.1 Bdr family repetitive protein [Borreliella burgdorferi]
MKAVLATTNITEDQIYREFLRLGMEQLIAQDLSKRYYHNELTYRDLENLEKQFGIRFENLISEISFLEKNLQKDIFNLDAKIDSVEKNLQKDIFNLDAKIDSVEKNLQKDIFNLAQALKKEVQINSQFLLEKLKVSNRIIIIITVIIVPIAISSITNIVMLLIAKFFK